MNVGTLSFKVGVRLDFHLDNQVTCGATLPSMALFGDTQVHSIVYTFRHVNLLFDCAVLGTSTSTSHTRTANDSTSAITISTDLLHHEGSLLYSLVALTATATTGGW